MPDLIPWDPEKKYTHVAQPSQYSTASGGKVVLCRLEIEYFLGGIMEGHPDCLRAHRLNDVRKAGWLIVKEPEDGTIPRYIIGATFSDYSSQRTLCWFDEELGNLEKRIVENIGSFDWARETAGDPKLDYEDY